MILAGVIDDSPASSFRSAALRRRSAPGRSLARSVTCDARRAPRAALHELAALSTRSGEQTEIQRAALALAANGLARLGKE
ncbi:MAG: hypothetical protein U0802_25980 [Candidatus Binatia bacterium]